jgi:hypothetical protein
MSINQIINTIHSYGAICSRRTAAYIKLNLLSFTTLWKISAVALLLQKHRFSRINKEIIEGGNNRPQYRRARPLITKKVLAIVSLLYLSTDDINAEAIEALLHNLVNKIRLGKLDRNYLGMDYPLIKRTPTIIPIRDESNNIIGSITTLPLEQQFNKIVYS